MSNLDKQVRKFKIIRFLALPLGALMMLLTKNSFGGNISTILGTVFAVAFWIICERSRYSIISEAFVDAISDSIKKIGEVENIIEIKHITSGMIVRIYLLNVNEKLKLYKSEILDKIKTSALTNHLWMLQISDMNNMGEFDSVRMIFDEQLMEHIKEIRKNK